MPQTGTKKVELANGQSLYLPEEEARVAQLLRDGCRLQQRMEADNEALRAIKNELAEIATARRGEKQTVHLSSPDGQEATVTWRRELLVDPVRAEALREPLGESFGKVFCTRILYSLAKGYKEFMRLPQGSLESAKKHIGAAIEPKEHKPSVSLQDIVQAGG